MTCLAVVIFSTPFLSVLAHCVFYRTILLEIAPTSISLSVPIFYSIHHSFPFLFFLLIPRDRWVEPPAPEDTTVIAKEMASA